MLALKKKREAEAAQKAAEEKAAAAMDTTASSSEAAPKVNLLGVGGQKVKTAGDNGTGGGKKRSPGEIRIQKGKKGEIVEAKRKRDDLSRARFLTSIFNSLLHDDYLFRFIHLLDIAELDGGKVATVTWKNPNDLTNFDVLVCPDSGYWKGASYHFSFSIPPHYPHSPPKVECKTKIYHPNIDLQGKVCLNILREDWKPVLDIISVIYGLIYWFY